MKKRSHVWKALLLDMLVIEFGPVGVFFIVFYLTNFLQATLALGLSTLVTLVISRLVNGRVPWFAVFTGTITVVTAVVTYWLNQPWILIVKDTVYYLFFALLLAGSVLLRKYMYRFFFGHIFALTTTGWKKLELRWMYFFIAAGVSNEVVRVLLTPDEWVMYKQGMVIIFLVFGFYQLRMIGQHRMPGTDTFGIILAGSKE